MSLAITRINPSRWKWIDHFVPSEGWKHDKTFTKSFFVEGRTRQTAKKTVDAFFQFISWEGFISSDFGWKQTKGLMDFNLKRRWLFILREKNLKNCEKERGSCRLSCKTSAEASFKVADLTNRWWMSFTYSNFYVR